MYFFTVVRPSPKREKRHTKLRSRRTKTTVFLYIAESSNFEFKSLDFFIFIEGDQVMRTPPAPNGGLFVLYLAVGQGKLIPACYFLFQICLLNRVYLCSEAPFYLRRSRQIRERKVLLFSLLLGGGETIYHFPIYLFLGVKRKNFCLKRGVKRQKLCVKRGVIVH